MSHFPHGAFVAVHAAQEQRRRDQEEEEEMTRYSTDELDDNWEFKIVRSETGAFRRPEVFQSLLQEESIAGWELVEKLDNRRMPAGAMLPCRPDSTLTAPNMEDRLLLELQS